jgi:3-oxoacyl-[acyl-carrier protein] reductase
MTEAALDAWGRIDILVNNAGITHLPAPMEEVSEEDFDRVLAVNVKSVYLTAREIVPQMKARARARSSTSPRPRASPPAAAQLVQRLQGLDDHRDQGDGGGAGPAGIRVNALCPVAGETPLLKSFMGEDTPEMRAKFLATIPLGRFSTPQDMGEAAAFLCSDAASMITGVALEVDGGRCI